ncbi:high osmolarity signaling protein sho1 [Aureobasidium subglaciale]|nr:high osmolarity signaling protein sho1 [Aureobasidium subglaciale]KAI5215040.1 high osmolarity signaling protein sho1 [Aureobasidium subglaciale]KAI5218163.1 high osmolarity signaling protein sho1 [Aureobasidium subglaciale]KAI5255881.1 high osmolarity signaling protein sho1 [Aureobasidium subglaciale]
MPYSSGSPSLQKMEASRMYGARKPRFSCGQIIGDPFALATSSIAIIAWLIAFVASVISKIHGQYPNYSWWALVYMFFCIVGVLVTVASDSVFTYHVAIVGFLAAGLVFTTSSVNSLVYSSDGAHEAAAAGFILLSMVARPQIVWIFYYGSQPTASSRNVIDSFALHRDSRVPSRMSRQPQHNSYRPETSVSQQPQMYTSAQLGGFETSSPVTGFPGGALGAMDSNRDSGARYGQNNLAPHSAATDRPNSTAVAPAEYPYRAKAIYSYEANPDDANEISFIKHEVLEISDVSGRWWQAKKENGDTGIAPSNYLILL